jgi:formylglycine-generating enzyme required for sulfatase activity
MVWVPGGKFTMGSDDHYEEESPAHDVEVNGFWIDRYEVTNKQFDRFVRETGHVTFAEKVPVESDYPGTLQEMLFAGSSVFLKPAQRVSLDNAYNWWTYVDGADWRHPQGPSSSIKGLANHPVVHVTFEDVQAYAAWAGKALPTEAEFEFAARGGSNGTEYAWGDEFAPGGKQMANTWQGDFPTTNDMLDGFEGTAPVGAFPANGYGLYDMIGNVWEWTTDFYQDHSEIEDACCVSANPRGGAAEKSYDPSMPDIKIPRRVIKGGSHLCAPNYCRRYRPPARMPEPVDTSTSHVGFRCVVRPS